MVLQNVGSFLRFLQTDMSRRMIGYIKKVYLIVLIGILLLFTGCAKLTRTIEFKGNGMVTGTVDGRFSEKIISLTGQSKDELFQGITQGVDGIMKTKSYQVTENNETWYGMSGTVTLPKALSDELINAIMGEDISATVTQTGFWIKNIQIDLVCNKKVSLPDDSFEKTIADLNRLGISDELIIKVPYEIVATNGLIDGNDNTVVTWDIYDLECGDATTKKLTLSYINWTPFIVISIVIGILFFVVLPIIIIVNSVKASKKRRKKENKIQEDFNSQYWNGNNYPGNNYYQNPNVNMNNGLYYQDNISQPYYNPDQNQPVVYNDGSVYQDSGNPMNPEMEEYETKILTEQKPLDTVIESVNETVADVAGEIPQNNPVDDILKMYGPGGSIYKK